MDIIRNIERFGSSAERLTLKNSVLGVTAIAILLLFGKAIYNIYFHPLSKFPGPRRAAISNLFFAQTQLSGKSARIIKDLHDKYGDVVRWGPNKLSFATAEAWKDVYGAKKGKPPLLKDPNFYAVDDTARAEHIVTVSDLEKHAQMRKMMSHAFSAKALLEQEDIVIEYADMLMNALADESRNGPVNLPVLFNWATFDILGELAFGESFGSTKNRKTDSWISIILDQVVWNNIDQTFNEMSLPSALLNLLIPKRLLDAGRVHAELSKRKILDRQNRKPDRKDFCSYIFAEKENLKITDWQLAAHANALIIAGSETSATLLSGLTYWLLRTPHAYQKLREEIRGAFKTSSEINSRAATPLSYLTACINEALRIYPPVPLGMPRLTPNEGETIAGHFVPGGASVGVHMWSVTHNSANFKDPYTFRPERWTEANPTDNLAASQPFLLGPRACMGQNMAWMELRVLITKLIYHFDFKLIDDKLDWDHDGTSYSLWIKPPLLTEATVVNPLP